MKHTYSRTKPRISVVMPVYNAGRFLHQSIQSILDQTYSNFEFIIVNDASTDNTDEILSSYAQNDPRITVLNNPYNIGVSRSVERAMQKAKGDYIARMDADDISLPTRFQKQIDYLTQHPDVVALGTQCITIDENSHTIGEKTFPLSHKDIYRYIFRFIPVQQPSLMIARYRLPKHFDFYSNSFRTAEEVELIFRLFQYGKVENLPDKLLKYRIHPDNTSFLSVKKTFYNTLISRIRAIYAYDYQPTLSGIIATVLQTLIILLLPKTAIMFIYNNMRFIRKGTQKMHIAMKRFRLTLAQA